jgi:hypothetical protein
LKVPGSLRGLEHTTRKKPLEFKVPGFASGGRTHHVESQRSRLQVSLRGFEHTTWCTRISGSKFRFGGSSTPHGESYQSFRFHMSLRGVEHTTWRRHRGFRFQVSLRGFENTTWEGHQGSKFQVSPREVRAHHVEKAIRVSRSRFRLGGSNTPREENRQSTRFQVSPRGVEHTTWRKLSGFRVPDFASWVRAHHVEKATMVSGSKFRFGGSSTPRGESYQGSRFQVSPRGVEHTT